MENQYNRVVKPGGSKVAQEAVAKVFELREFFELRGLGSLDHSGARLKDEYAAFDAERKFAVPNLKIEDPKTCQCGDVLKGLIKPWQCRLFGQTCNPQNPMGALMVSSEGACAAYFNFGKFRKTESDTAGAR